MKQLSHPETYSNIITSEFIGLILKGPTSILQIFKQFFIFHFDYIITESLNN
jgi:hypothetical protein